MTGSMLFIFAAAAGTAGAQDHGPDRDHQDQDQHDQKNQKDHHKNQQDQDHQDQDRHEQGHSKFDDHDRQVSRDWYSQHRDHRPAGLRDRDRLPAAYDSKLQDGYVLDGNMRGRIHSIPSDYSQRLPRAPRGYRYVFIGGNTVLIDSGYRVHDVLHFELNF